MLQVGLHNSVLVNAMNESYVTISEGHCNEGALKLAGGSTNNEGRVEICSNGIWGTICDANKWDSRDATVVCKQLGYKNPSKEVISKHKQLTSTILFHNYFLNA